MMMKPRFRISSGGSQRQGRKPPGRDQSEQPSRAPGKTPDPKIWAVLFLSVCLLGASCAPPNVTEDTSRLAHFVDLRPGVSTVDDAVALLGSSNSISTASNSAVVLGWSEIRGAHGLSVVIAFDPNKAMTRVAAVNRF